MASPERGCRCSVYHAYFSVVGLAVGESEWLFVVLVMEESERLLPPRPSANTVPINAPARITIDAANMHHLLNGRERNALRSMLTAMSGSDFLLFTCRIPDSLRLLSHDCSSIVDIVSFAAVSGGSASDGHSMS